MQGELTLQGAGERRGASTVVWALHTVYFSSSVRGSATPALHHVHLSTTTDTCANTNRMYPVGSAKDPAFPTFQQAKQCTLSGHLSTTSLPLSATLQSCVSSMKTFTCIDMQRESLCGAQRWQCKQARKQAATAMAARVSNLGNAKCQPQVPHPHYSKKGRAGQINARIAHKLRTGTAAGGPQMVGTHTTQNTLQQQEQNGGEESEKEVKKPE